MVLPELQTAFLFRQQPVPVPGDLRPEWRLGLLVLLLSGCCRGGKTSLARLHTLSWAVRTKETRQALVSVMKGGLGNAEIVVRFDPAMNRAVDFAIGERLTRRSGGGRIELTETGRAFADELAQNEAVFKSEKLFISEIQQRVTEALVNRIMVGR